VLQDSSAESDAEYEAPDGTLKSPGQTPTKKKKKKSENLQIKCYYCNSMFAFEKYLKKHIKRIHPECTIGMYCVYCSTNFKKRKFCLTLW